MKKLFSLMFVLALTGIVFNACNKDDDDDVIITNDSPSISNWTVDGMMMDMTSGDHTPGDTVTFSFMLQIMKD